MYSIVVQTVRCMKRLFAGCLLLLAALSAGNVGHAQNILVVNDNDYITYNSDTLRSALDHSEYSSYHYWSVPDSAGTGPTAAYMSAFDMVIWYCSTDGVALNIWDGSGTFGNSEVISYAGSGKPLWIIGQDILYQAYGTAPATISAGDFADQVMGLSSYDVQSYADDGSTGCAQLERVSGASALFPATLRWAFPTAWYIDGCTPGTNTTSLYQMGPAAYALAGQKTMFHHQAAGISVMSTLFDPALIDSFQHRVEFVQNSITYLWGATTHVANVHKEAGVNIYPNPAFSSFTANIAAVNEQNVTVSLYNMLGACVQQQHIPLVNGATIASVSLVGLPAGQYIVRVTGGSGGALYNGCLQKR